VFPFWELLPRKGSKRKAGDEVHLSRGAAWTLAVLGAVALVLLFVAAWT
jgi:hypothetical protein